MQNMKIWKAQYVINVNYTCIEKQNVNLLNSKFLF